MKKIYLYLWFSFMIINEHKAQMTLEECRKCDSIEQELRTINFEAFKGKTVNELLASHNLLKDLDKFYFIDDNWCIRYVVLPIFSLVRLEIYFEDFPYRCEATREHWNSAEYRKQKIEKVVIFRFHGPCPRLTGKH